MPVRRNHRFSRSSLFSVIALAVLVGCSPSTPNAEPPKEKKPAHEKQAPMKTSARPTTVAAASSAPVSKSNDVPTHVPPSAPVLPIASPLPPPVDFAKLVKSVASNADSAQPAKLVDKSITQTAAITTISAATTTAKPDNTNADAAMPANPLRQDTVLQQPSSESMLKPLPAATAKPLPVATTVSAAAENSKASPMADPADNTSHSRLRKNAEKYDAVKENGPIFEGWPKPRLALVITGRQDGYLEPCGCAGLDRMKGGISRRYTMINSLREKGWPLVVADVGGLSKGFGSQAVQKFHISVDAYRQMGYDAIGLGVNDLQFSSGDLISVTASQGKDVSPFVCANVGMGAFDPSLLQPYRIITVGGIRVGITGVLGQKHQKEVHNTELIMASAETKLAEVYAKLQKEADYLILLAYATLDESRQLAEKFPNFNIVVTAGGAPEPPDHPTPISGTHALMIQVGEKASNAIVIGLYDDPDPAKQVRYQRVPLDSRFANAVCMKQLMGMYQDQVKALGFEGLGIRTVPNPKAELQGKFVGSAKCMTCHEQSCKVWKRSGHSQALSSLEKADPPRQFDPECLSCHVIGWNPQGFFPYEGGYISREKTPHLTDVGCETCHGPGEKHCVAEAGGNLELQKKLQQAMTVTQAEAENHLCRNCHDLDNSPDFDFKTYWPLIEHHEKEK